MVSGGGNLFGGWYANRYSCTERVECVWKIRDRVNEGVGGGGSRITLVNDDRVPVVSLFARRQRCGGWVCVRAWSWAKVNG